MTFFYSRIIIIVVIIVVVPHCTTPFFHLALFICFAYTIFRFHFAVFMIVSQCFYVGPVYLITLPFAINIKFHVWNWIYVYIAVCAVARQIEIERELRGSEKVCVDSIEWKDGGYFLFCFGVPRRILWHAVRWSGCSKLSKTIAELQLKRLEWWATPTRNHNTFNLLSSLNGYGWGVFLVFVFFIFIWFACSRIRFFMTLLGRVIQRRLINSIVSFVVAWCGWLSIALIAGQQQKFVECWLPRGISIISKRKYLLVDNDFRIYRWDIRVCDENFDSIFIYLIWANIDRWWFTNS